MLQASQFHDLVSGRSRGLKAALARAALRAAETPYTLAVQWRNRRYNTGRVEIAHAAVPVISVGNLTLGGTGKTPMVAFLARWFRAQNARVTILSRGYGAEEGSRNDEALELELLLPDVPHLQNRDRVESAQVAVEELDCQVILLDDGFQHRRLHRDLDIVLLDALQPDGFGHVFPRGTLREPFKNLRRADMVVLSRADTITRDERKNIRQRVASIAPQAVYLEVSHRPLQLRDSQDRIQPLDTLAGKKVAAFCGIGNPTGFTKTLETCGYEVASLRQFPDHHNYNREDVQSLIDSTRDVKADAVVCTLKDLVKLDIPKLGSIPLSAIEIGLAPLGDIAELEAKLRPLLPRSESD